MHHNLIIKDGDTTKVVKEVLVDGIQFVDEKPRAGSTNPVTSNGVANATKNILDDGETTSQSWDIESATTSGYEVGKFFEEDGEVWQCTSIVNDGSNYVISAKKLNGVIPALNEFVDKMQTIAHALDTLEARLASVEDAVINYNLGDRIADSIDVQSLKIGGVDISEIFEPISE